MEESVETAVVNDAPLEEVVSGEATNEETLSGETLSENIYGGNDSEDEGAQKYEFGGFYEEGSESISEPPIPTGEVRASDINAETAPKQSSTKKAVATVRQSTESEVGEIEADTEAEAETIEADSNEVDDEDVVMTTANTMAVVEPMGISDEAILMMAHLATAVVVVAAIGMMALNFVKKPKALKVEKIVGNERVVKSDPKVEKIINKKK